MNQTQKLLASRWALATPLEEVLAAKVEKMLIKQDSVFVVHLKKKSEHVTRAKQILVNEVLTSQTIAMGRTQEGEIELIDSGLWIGAEIDEISGTVSKGSTKFMEVRLDLSRPNENKVFDGPGRPTEGALIEEMILNYVRESGNVRLKGKVRERHDSYKKFLKSHGLEMGYDGLSESTIGDYETKFRKNTKT